jgi:hypothetical protein
MNKHIAPEGTPLPQMPHQTSPPISRLPTEILAEIFEHAISLVQYEFSSDDGLRLLQHLLRVCRQWRAVTMAYPRLWSSLAFTSARTTAMMLRYSKESSVVVKANFFVTLNPPAKQAVLLALWNLSRVRILHIDGSRDVHERLFAALMGRPARLLESLRLTNREYPLRRTTMTLPLSLFAGVTPRLRHFAVHNLNSLWHSPLLRNLTHLEILNSTPAPLVALHDVLSRCPALHTLILENALPTASDQVQPPISLPLLSHLELGGDLVDCDVVIDSISFPSTTIVRLRSTRGPQLPHLITKLRDRVHAITRLLVDITPAFTCVKAWTIAEPLAPLDLFFEGSPTHSSLHAIFDGLALTPLVSLELSVDQRTLDTWETVSVDFSLLQNLQVLSVSCWDVGALISALTPVSEQAVPLPALREFTLCEVHFNPHHMSHLESCLIRRRDNNAEVEKLRLLDWVGLPRDYVDRLRASLGDVIVTGETRWGRKI